MQKWNQGDKLEGNCNNAQERMVAWDSMMAQKDQKWLDSAYILRYHTQWGKSEKKDNKYYMQYDTLCSTEERIENS